MTDRIIDVKGDRGWTPLEFYSYIVRNLGVPATFRYDFDRSEWIAEGPFTKASDKTLAQLDAQGV